MPLCSFPLRAKLIYSIGLHIRNPLTHPTFYSPYRIALKMKGLPSVDARAYPIFAHNYATKIFNIQVINFSEVWKWLQKGSVVQHFSSVGHWVFVWLYFLNKTQFVSRKQFPFLAWLFPLISVIIQETAWPGNDV